MPAGKMGNRTNKIKPSSLIIEERVRDLERWRLLLTQFLGEECGKMMYDFYVNTRFLLVSAKKTRAKVHGVRISIHFRNVCAHTVIKSGEWFIKQLSREGVVAWLKWYPRAENIITIMFLIPTIQGTKAFVKRHPVYKLTNRFILLVERHTGTKIMRRYAKSGDM